MQTESDLEIGKGLGIGDVSKMCEVPRTLSAFGKRNSGIICAVAHPGKAAEIFRGAPAANFAHKKALWEDRFSIQGAKRLLRGNGIVPMVLDDSSSPITDTHDLALHLARFIGNYLTNSRMTASG